MRRTNRSARGPRVGDRAWWSAVLVVAIAGVALIRAGQEGVGWALLLVAASLALMRAPWT